MIQVVRIYFGRKYLPGRRFGENLNLGNISVIGLDIDVNIVVYCGALDRDAVALQGGHEL